MYPDDYARPKSDKTLWIVLGIVGGVVVVCSGLMFIAGMAIYMMGTSVQNRASVIGTSISNIDEEIEAELEAEDFLDDLKDGNFAAAYARTSGQFQTQNTLADLQALPQRHPILGNFSTQTTTTVNNTPGRFTLDAEIFDRRGNEHSATIVMVKENDQWRVDQVSVP